MRNIRVIPAKETYAAVIDGNCEAWYLQMLRRNERSIPVNIEPKIPQKKSLADQLLLVKDLSVDYAKVFWIIDFDGIQKETKETKKGDKPALQWFREFQADLKKTTNNVITIINNPCIEFWFLLHFEDTSKYFDTCAKAEARLKKYLKDYAKTQKYFTKENNDIYTKLSPLLGTAIANAQKLPKFDSNNMSNSVTEMHLLFKILFPGKYEQNADN